MFAQVLFLKSYTIMRRTKVSVLIREKEHILVNVLIGDKSHLGDSNKENLI